MLLESIVFTVIEVLTHYPHIKLLLSFLKMFNSIFRLSFIPNENVIKFMRHHSIHNSNISLLKSKYPNLQIYRVVSQYKCICALKVSRKLGLIHNNTKKGLDLITAVTSFLLPRNNNFSRKFKKKRKEKENTEIDLRTLYILHQVFLWLISHKGY